MESYLALMYRWRGQDFVAESLAYPGLAADAASTDEGLRRLAAEMVAAVRDGEPVTGAGEVAVTSIAVLAASQGYTAHTYTAVVTHDGDAYTSLCPALGVASQGTSVDDALAMLREAATLYLEDLPPAEHDELVYVAGIELPSVPAEPATRAGVGADATIA